MVTSTLHLSDSKDGRLVLLFKTGSLSSFVWLFLINKTIKIMHHKKFQISESDYNKTSGHYCTMTIFIIIHVIPFCKNNFYDLIHKIFRNSKGSKNKIN